MPPTPKKYRNDYKVFVDGKTLNKKKINKYTPKNYKKRRISAPFH